MNSAIQKFIDEIKTARQPFFTNDTQVVCGGRVVLTAMPSLESDKVDSYRLEIPKDLEVTQELPYAVLFVVAMFGAETFIRIRLHLGRFLRNGQPFSEIINGLSLRAFGEGENLVMMVDSNLGKERR